MKELNLSDTYFKNETEFTIEVKGEEYYGVYTEYGNEKECLDAQLRWLLNAPPNHKRIEKELLNTIPEMLESGETYKEQL